MASTGVTFTAGSKTYVADLETLRAFLEDYATEIETARGGLGNLEARFDTVPSTSQAAAGNISMGGHHLTNVADPGQPQDTATKAYVDATVIGGGSPGSIPITSLNKGAATASQLIRVNAGATAVEGVSPGALPVTDLSPGAAVAGKYLKINGAGTAIIGADASASNVKLHYLANL